MNTTTPSDPNKSCFGCPSLLTPGESAVFFRKSVGVSVCAKFGKVMGNSHTEKKQSEKIAKQIAKSCSEHGKPRPTTPDWQKAQFKVSLGDPALMGATAPAVNQQHLVKTCSTCTNFIREDVVASQLGWSSALCAVKGKLLLGNRYTHEATGCESRSFGAVRTDIGNLVMLPEYAEDFKASDDPVKNYFRSRQAVVADPVDYETDKPVSTADEARGIRAWREVTDPVTGNSVHLPIYKIEFFSPEQRAKIPRTGDDEHPEDYIDHSFLVYKVAVLWTELDETPALWGVPGVGKTELFRHLAWLMCLPFERFSITGSTELEDLAGRHHYSAEEGTYWTDGRFTRAWTSPCVIVADEPNAGPPDVWQFFRPLTDNSKQLVLDMNNGEHRDRNDDCYLGMAMNPAWEAKNVGAHMISDADSNRLMHMFIQLPPPELEREILRTACKRDGWELPENKLKTIMGIAQDIRALTETENSTLPITWGIRPQLKVARACKWFDWMTVYRMATADFLEPSAQQELLNVVRSHVS